jgi:hypothetical protein
MSTIVYVVSVGIDHAGKFEKIAGDLGRIMSKRFGHAKGNGGQLIVTHPTRALRAKKDGGNTRTRMTMELAREVLNICERPAREIAQRLGISLTSVERVLAGQHKMAKRVLSDDKTLANKLTLVRFKNQV